MKKWIVVSDGSCAKIFRQNGNEKFDFQFKLENPEAQMKNSEINADAPGMAISPTKVPYMMSGQKDPQQDSIKAFAKEVIERLEKERKTNDLDELVVVAAPQFLGYLRGEASAPLQNLVSNWVNKDLVNMPDKDLQKQLKTFTS